MMQKFIAIGRLGQAPELRKLESGSTVAKFSLATDESYKGKDGNKVEKTAWHNLIVWDKQAEIVEKYLKKGMLVYVEGKVTYREYEKDGEKKYFTEIVVNNFKMLEKKEDSSGEHPEQPVSSSVDDNGTPTESDSSDLPF